MRGEIVPDIVVARAVLTPEVSRQRRNDPASGERQKSAVGYGVHTTAPGVVGLQLQAISKALIGCQLQAIVVTVRPGVQLGNCTKSRVLRLAIRKRRKAAFTYSLIAVHLSLVRLVYRTGPNILSTQISGRSDLLLEGKAPLHEIGCVELAVRNGRNRDRLKASAQIRERGGAGELTLHETGIERLVSRDCCVYGTIRNSRSNCCPADVAEEPPLKCFRIGWVRTHEIDNTAGQNVTE